MERLISNLLWLQEQLVRLFLEKGVLLNYSLQISVERFVEGKDWPIICKMQIVSKERSFSIIVSLTESLVSENGVMSEPMDTQQVVDYFRRTL